MDKLIGEGGGRKVFLLEDGLTVSKVAYNDLGEKSNRKEWKITNSVAPRESLKFNPVIEHSPDFSYIICPFVNVFKNKNELFNETGIDIEDLEEYEYSGLETINELFSTGDIEIETYNILADMDELCRAARINSAELAVPNHWGRDLVGDLVIIDYGT